MNELHSCNMVCHKIYCAAHLHAISNKHLPFGMNQHPGACLFLYL
jgi:hypothetical protein